MINPNGYTYAHEHLHIDLSGFKNNLDCRLDQYQPICDEMRELVSKGVANIVEVTNRYMGRNPQFLLNLMRDSGINVIASTGYYTDSFYPPMVRESSAQQLAQTMIDEIEIGIDGTELKAGVIAEIGTSEGVVTPDEAKVFHAAALAHHATGLPISTHTSFSTMGLEQIALLKQHGVSLERVVIGHCDLKEQPDLIMKMIDMGVYVQFDTIGKNSYFPDERRIAMLVTLAERGLLDKVMLSMDITRRSHLKANGGSGFSYLVDSFVPMLLAAGISHAQVEMMLRHNPNKFFATQGT
ncbi:phosphotriesterase-related protein [Yersinia enterocolitica]|uniref:phosphotriesterase-related protein n=1 Tax=Yersinia enterocolitica TaxID=630 RepID=UPI001C60B512|nr:phosphotriesterase-related protein [Yersinia enterocolitica]MBW5819116.1 phosphotriesterase-related protein [Yersinia enterocolitica]MBW5848973.1 phosphotriesterase-related protein [Yersinia enterocolitica]MBW5867456.1 phosphotriesterase-related protein [Yersinia enterocolitica]MBW5875237.1 phosphotriesterase-related protein [Yersinia enterocolitica]